MSETLLESGLVAFRGYVSSAYFGLGLGGFDANIGFEVQILCGCFVTKVLVSLDQLDPRLRVRVRPVARVLPSFDTPMSLM